MTLEYCDLNSNWSKFISSVGHFWQHQLWLCASPFLLRGGKKERQLSTQPKKTKELSNCRLTSSSYASALPSPSPFTMSEVTGLLRWRRKWKDEMKSDCWKVLSAYVDGLLHKHNLTYIGFCQQVGKHSAAPLLLCGCQSDLRWENLPELNSWIFF